MLGAFQFSFRQFRFWKDLFEIFRKFLAAGVVHADLLFINQIPTQIGGSRRHHVHEFGFV